MDAGHVAAATVAGADLILSWDFRHLVRYDHIRAFNGVNAPKGYRPVDIRSPMEMGVMRAAGYEGPLSYEYERKWHPDQLPPAEVGLQASIQYVRGLVG